MKLTLLLLFLPLLAHGQRLQPGTVRDSHVKAWRWSAVALASGFAHDAASSYGCYESRAFVDRGRFGAQGTAVTAGIAAGVIAGEWLVVRKWPRARGFFVGLNVAGAAVEHGQAIRNWGCR